MLIPILVTAVNAVFPIVLLILLGYGLRQTGFLPESFLPVGNKLVFCIFLPAMLFVNVYNVESFEAIDWKLVLYSSGVICLLFLLGLGVVAATTSVPDRKGVVLQCIFRSNFAIIGLPLAQALGGEQAVSVAAVISAFSIPLFNIFAVIALSMYAPQQGSRKLPVTKILREIVTNPLIIAVALGLVCLGLREGQVRLWGEAVFTLKEDCKFLYTAVDFLQAMATPLGLIVLGGQFRFSAVRGLLREILTATLWRLVLAPALGIGGAILLGIRCTAAEYAALIALFGTPVAVSSAIMAREMGGDEQLATQLVVWTSIGSVVTVFLQVCILMLAGLL